MSAKQVSAKHLAAVFQCLVQNVPDGEYAAEAGRLAQPGWSHYWGKGAPRKSRLTALAACPVRTGVPPGLCVPSLQQLLEDPLLFTQQTPLHKNAGLAVRLTPEQKSGNEWKKLQLPDWCPMLDVPAVVPAEVDVCASELGLKSAPLAVRTNSTDTEVHPPQPPPPTHRVRSEAASCPAGCVSESERVSAAQLSRQDRKAASREWMN